MRYLNVTLILGSFVCGLVHAGHLSWQDSVLKVTLPPYAAGFQSEIKVAVAKNNGIEIRMPKKSPAYWLEAKDDASDAKVASLFFGSGAFDCKKIMATIKAEYPHLKSLYESPSYITDGFSLETHTMKVLKQFNEQKKFYILETVSCSHITDNLERLLIATIFVHDIGKPLGARFKQHENTVPIARYALKRWGFSRKEIDLATALIDNDILGELAQEEKFKSMTVKGAFLDIQDLAKTAGLTTYDYSMIQTLFYISDASSYSWIRSGAFTEEKKTGFLWPKSKRLNALYKQYIFQ